MYQQDSKQASLERGERIRAMSRSMAAIGCSCFQPSRAGQEALLAGQPRQAARAPRGRRPGLLPLCACPCRPHVQALSRSIATTATGSASRGDTARGVRLSGARPGQPRESVRLRASAVGHLPRRPIRRHSPARRPAPSQRPTARFSVVAILRPPPCLPATTAAHSGIPCPPPCLASTTTARAAIAAIPCPPPCPPPCSGARVCPMNACPVGPPTPPPPCPSCSRNSPCYPCRERLRGG